MIDASQIRAARAMLRMEQTELAKAAGVSVETIKRMEKATGVPRVQQDTLRSVKRALERAGIVFLDDDENKPGGRGLRLLGDSNLEELKARLIHIFQVIHEIDNQIEYINKEISKDTKVSGGRVPALNEIVALLEAEGEKYIEEQHSLETYIEAETDMRQAPSADED